MRWDELFADLEGRADALEAAERAGEVEERTRSELAGLTSGDRLRAAVGAAVVVTVTGALTLRGRVSRVGPDWLLLDEGDGREALVVIATVLTVAGTGRFAQYAPGVVAARLGLRSVLRGIARDRSGVRLHLIDGSVIDATIDRVGADFVDAARHPAGEPRRRGEVRDVVLVPFAALAAVRRTV